MADPKDAKTPEDNHYTERPVDSPLSPLIEAGWKIESAEEPVFALEQLLIKHGLAIAAGSRFEQHMLQTIELAEQRRSGVADDENDVRSRYRSLVGVREIANLILAVRDGV